MAERAGRAGVSLRADALAFGAWVALLGLVLQYGRATAPLFEGAPGRVVAGGMLLVAAGALAWAWRRLRGLPPGRRAWRGAALAGVGLGMAWLAWAQPLLIERAHLILYGVMGLLSWRLAGHFAGGARRVLLAAVMAAAVGAADEAVQYFHPQRVGDWADVGTNAASAFLAVLAARALQRR